MWEINMDWIAKWIWAKEDRFYFNTFVLFRKEITISLNEVEKAEAYIFADSRYLMFINGKAVGYGPVPSDRLHDCYDRYDICPFLQHGLNTIAVIVCHYGNHGGNYLVGRPEFIFQSEISYGNGKKVIICTDETWKCKFALCWGVSTARRSVFKPLTELFDARLYPDGWELNGYDDKRWIYAKVLGPVEWHVKGEFNQKEIKNLKYHRVNRYSAKRIGRIEFDENPSLIFKYSLREQVKEIYCGHNELLSGDYSGLNLPLSVNNAPENQCTYVVFDFGQDVVGRIGFKIKAAEGAIIDVTYRELDQEGKLLLSGIDVRNWVRYVTREGVQSWQTFDYDTFRYVQLAIHGSPGLVEILEVWTEEQGYPIQNGGEFECSDPVLNKLWDASVHTVGLCMQDIIPDNPGREQAPWTGDIEFAKMPIYYIAGEYELTKRSLIQTSYGQMKNGKMRCVWPSGLALQFYAEGLLFDDFGCEIPHHSIQWASSVWRHYLYSGDIEVLEKLFPNIKLLINWFTSHEDTYGILCPDKSWDDRWNWLDWEGMKNLWVPLNFFYCVMLYDSARIAGELNKNEDEAYFNNKAERLKRSLIEKYWSTEYESFVDCMVEENGIKKPFFSQLTLSLAINNNIYPEGKRQYIADRLANGLEDCSPVHKYHPYQAYSITNNHKKVLNEFREKWTRMISVNETNTFQEVWGDGTEFVCSMCQSAAAVPGYYLPAYILGVRPLKPGFKEFVIEPCPCDLTWAKGRVPTPYGFIHVEWTNNDAGLKLKVITPEGFTKVEDVSEAVQFTGYRYIREE